MPRHPVTLRGATAAADMAGKEEMLTEQPSRAVDSTTQMVQDLSEAIDALLGVLTMVQDAGVLPDDAAAALDDLVTAAEKASAALDAALRGESAEAPMMGEEEHSPAKPVLKVPMRAGGGGAERTVVTRARTPNYGLEE
jgi:ABC-type uncharacterized transport system involved in gliding motility auxiliary subunit